MRSSLCPRTLRSIAMKSVLCLFFENSPLPTTDARQWKSSRTHPRTARPFAPLRLCRRRESAFNESRSTPEESPATGPASLSVEPRRRALRDESMIDCEKFTISRTGPGGLYLSHCEKKKMSIDYLTAEYVSRVFLERRFTRLKRSGEISWAERPPGTESCDFCNGHTSGKYFVSEILYDFGRVDVKENFGRWSAGRKSCEVTKGTGGSLINTGISGYFRSTVYPTLNQRSSFGIIDHCDYFWLIRARTSGCGCDESAIKTSLEL